MRSFTSRFCPARRLQVAAGVMERGEPGDLAALLRRAHRPENLCDAVDSGGKVQVVNIRVATDDDWPLIYPLYAAIMAEGKTYPFPVRQTREEARPWWMEQPPGQTVVAVRDDAVVGSAPAVHLWQALGFQIIGTVPESFDHPEHGLVGLHVMYRRL